MHEQQQQGYQPLKTSRLSRGRKMCHKKPASVFSICVLKPGKESWMFALPSQKVL